MELLYVASEKYQFLDGASERTVYCVTAMLKCMLSFYNELILPKFNNKIMYINMSFKLLYIVYLHCLF